MNPKGFDENGGIVWDLHRTETPPKRGQERSCTDQHQTHQTKVEQAFVPGSRLGGGPRN